MKIWSLAPYGRRKFSYKVDFQLAIYIMNLNQVTFTQCLLCIKPGALSTLILEITLGISSEDFHFTDAHTKDLKSLLTCLGSLC